MSLTSDNDYIIKYFLYKNEQNRNILKYINQISFFIIIMSLFTIYDTTPNF